MMSAGRSAGFLEGLTVGMFGSAVGAGALLYLLRRGDLSRLLGPLLRDLSPWVFLEIAVGLGSRRRLDLLLIE